MKFLKHIALFSTLCIQLTAWSQPLAADVEKVLITYEVKKLHGINSTFADFSPVIFGKKLYFTSNREYNLQTYGEGNWKKSKYMNIFESHVRPEKDSMVFLSVQPLKMNFNSGTHAGPLSFVADGSEVFYSKTVLSKESRKNKTVDKPKLYVAKIVDGKWIDETLLPFCVGNFSYGHPSVSADGKKLYFASDMQGGKGGKDIFVSERTNDSWGTPKNVAEINTSGNEMFPCIVDNMLYFASDGHPGEGSLDLFKTEIKANVPGEIVNLGETINTPKDDFGITFNPNKKSGFFSSDRVDTNGKDDIWYFDVIETVIVRTQDLAGQFRYRALGRDYATGKEVILMDEDGNLVMKTRTDEQGKFAFRELPIDGNYSIKLASEDDVELMIFGVDGQPTSFLKRDSEGQFVYRQLEFDKVSTLSLIDETDMDLSTNTGRLSGQFVYEEMARDYPEGLLVHLVDSDGNIQFSTKTDSEGNFEFRELSLDKSYIIKTKEELKDYTILVFNRRGDVVAQLKGNHKGEFVYRKLGIDGTRPMMLVEESDADVNLLAMSNVIYGRFHYRKSEMDYPGGLNVNALDADGNLLYKGKTDPRGYFRFTSMPMDRSSQFVLVNNDPDPELGNEVILTIYDRKGKPIGVIVKGEDGFFSYSKMEYIVEEVENVDISDVDVLLQIKNKELPTIYYDYNSSFLGDISAEKLRQIAQVMLDNPSLTLEIGSHTDATASDDYNMELSKKRTEGVLAYLKRKGIAESRLNGKWYGETKLVNKCKNNVECPDEEHAKNRRTEFVFK